MRYRRRLLRDSAGGRAWNVEATFLDPLPEDAMHITADPGEIGFINLSSQNGQHPHCHYHTNAATPGSTFAQSRRNILRSFGTTGKPTKASVLGKRNS
jgi:hypothetical protein